MARVKLFITVDVDEEEYPMPADGQIGEEIEEQWCMTLSDKEGLHR